MLPERNSLPNWMLTAPAFTHRVPVGLPTSGKKLTGFTEKTIHAIFQLLREALFGEQFARQKGTLQKIDPRSKLLISLALLVTVSFVHSISLLWMIYTLVLLLAWTSRIRFWFFFKRVWLFVPLVTAIIALPATLNWITPGNPLWVLVRFQQKPHWARWSFPPTLAITDNGARAALLFVSRVGVSVSIVVLLTLTTTWQKLLRALRVLGVPQFFVFTLGMTYRYLRLLLGLVLDLHLGKKSRTLRASRWSQDQEWVASRMGYLFKRSHNLGESVYGAMLARGFRGEPKILEELHWGRLDYLALSVSIVFCMAILLLQEFLRY